MTKINRMSLLENIKNTLAKRAIEKVLKEQKRTTVFRNLEEVKSILILFESEENEKNRTIRKIIANLRENGKKVSVWGYVDKKDSVTAVLPDFRLFANKEINIIDIPKPMLREEFLLNSYDMIIDLTTASCIPVDYLLAIATAPFKVARYKPYKGIADLMIDIKEYEDEAYLFEQIIFYLNSIQAKN